MIALSSVDMLMALRMLLVLKMKIEKKDKMGEYWVMQLE